jgi:hypothetical protein
MPSGLKVAVGRGVQGVPVGDEAIGVFVAGLTRVLGRDKGRGFGELGRLDRSGRGLASPGPRRCARRACTRGPRGSLLLCYRLQAGELKQADDAQDKR